MHKILELTVNKFVSVFFAEDNIKGMNAIALWANVELSLKNTTVRQMTDWKKEKLKSIKWFQVSNYESK